MSFVPTAHSHTAHVQSKLDSSTPTLGSGRTETSINGIVGRSAAIWTMVQQMELVAPTEATVLIFGESGTGKELIARAIHQRSRRKNHKLVRVNCASIPKELYESEFFGHAKGAFTGAVKDRAGRFELANGGTLFLDEVGEIPLELQGKLLRVLQEGEYERVGEETTRKVNVRVVAATNRDLTKDVESGRFRQDLYYRLNVYPIPVVALRHRKDDIPLLAAHFVKESAERLGCPVPSLSESQIKQLQAYDWPGNVRELQNVIERAIIQSQGRPLEFDLPQRDSDPIPPLLIEKVATRIDDGEIFTEAEMQQWQRTNLLAALQLSRWRIYGAGGAAERLGVKPTTLVSRIQKLGIKKPD